MSKHRKHNRRKKSPSPFTGEGRGEGLSLFFSEVLPFIERLEKEDKLLLVLPTDDNNHTQGIVCSDELALDVNASYIAKMAENVRHCGTLETYYSFIQRNPKWAAKHNPDQLLLNICRAARLVIAYRYGLQLGTQEYNRGETMTNGNDTLRYDDDNPENSNNRNAEKSSSSSSLSLDDSPLFITMMSDEGSPQSIGYELAGIITLEEYKPQQS